MNIINNWNSIIGHKRPQQILQKMIGQQHIPQGLIFVGKAHLGKMTVAKIFAAALLCEADNGQPCGQCWSCRQVATDSHMGLMLIESSGSEIKIEKIRQLRWEAAYKSGLSDRRIIIVSQAELLGEAAANALLKTLEEPPENMTIILLCEYSSQLLPTIVSRAILLNFTSVSIVELSAALQTDYNLDSGKSQLIAGLAEGCPGLARQLLAADGMQVRQQALTILEKLTWLEESVLLVPMALPADSLAATFNQLTILWRDLLLLKVAHGQRIVNIDKLDKLRNWAVEWTINELISALDQARRQKMAVRNSNLRLAVWESILQPVLEWRLEQCKK